MAADCIDIAAIFLQFPLCNERNRSMTFSDEMLRWYDENKRDLPWRHETDPYRIWVSEIMLQQTRAETVSRRYADFLARFPTVFDLAQAPEEDVLKAWEGLGYYARARNLHKAAKIIVRQWNGKLPPSAEQLRQLPGVGAYAACSVASIAFGEAVPALDANLARVFSRVIGRREPLASPADLYPEALAHVSQDRPGDFNQALMDLGATICLPRSPKCGICPIFGSCAAGQSGTPEDFPEKAPKPLRREIQRTVLVVLLNGKVLIRQRPSRGLLGGLWEFPTLEPWFASDALLGEMTRAGFLAPRQLQELPPAAHTFTHLVWRMHGVLLHCEGAPADLQAADVALLNAVAMPSALHIYRKCAMDAMK